MTIVKVFDIFVIVTTSSSLLVGMGMPEESFSVESTSQEPFFALLESAGSFFFASLGKFPSHWGSNPLSWGGGQGWKG